MARYPCPCSSPERHVGRRVVLTGGPGAGKTAVLEVMRRQFCEHVVVLSDAARIVFHGGLPRRATDSARRAAQLAVFHVQDQLERIALTEGHPAVVLCDRGVLDGLAYWPDDPETYLRAVGTTREDAFARYAAVIHLLTPIAPGPATKPASQRPPDDAAAIDARLLEAWRGHPHRHVIDCGRDFLAKLAHALAVVQAEVPPCCRVERTRDDAADVSALPLVAQPGSSRIAR